MSTNEALEYVAQALVARYGAGEARSISRIVLEDVFDWKPGRRPFVLPPKAMTQLEAIKTRLERGEPVQYVLGEADFFGYKFKVNPAVLIPRPETEELVEWILDTLKSTPSPHHSATSLLDIGTGSGCIPLTLAKEYPQLRVTGLDIAAAALTVARENAERLGVEATFTEVDILAPPDDLPSYQVIVSNPPYISRDEIGLMPEHVVQHEPEIALFVNHPDPLLFYRRISNWAAKHVLPGGFLFFECNEFSGRAVAAIVRDAGFREVELRSDLQGKERMVKGRLGE